MLLSGLSIRWKLLIPVIFIFSMTVAQIFLIINMSQAQKADAIRVNLAGRQRMLSQKITKETLNYTFKKDPKILEAKDNTMEILDKSLKALINGGVIELSGKTVLIQPTENKEILSALKEAEQYLGETKHVFDEALHQTDEITVSNVNDVSNGLLQRFDKITGMYERASDAMVRRNMTLIYICLFFCLMVAAAAWYYVNRSFIKPILSLRDTANKIAAGNLT
ncbi:MAG: type IV pili methyl-accepting chemotaxis transducer N-terminal domain-containing protein [Bacillota bacterium]